MIQHIVLWRLQSADQFEAIRAALQAHQGRIPGRRAVDFALTCDFESREAIVDAHIAEHWIADYEL